MYSNFGTFEIASLPNVLGHYLRKYGIHSEITNKKSIMMQKQFCAKQGY